MPRLDERLARAAALLPAPDGAPARRRARPGPGRAPCSRARATCGAWTTRAACCACATPRACATSALLLANPGVEFHAVDVATAAEGGAAPAAAERRRASPCAPGTGDAGPALDSQAKAEYRSRLEDLRAEIEEAESFNDPERAARAREEMDFIAHELSAAVGLGGRDRTRRPRRPSARG